MFVCPTDFRNEPVIDGGFGNGFEELCPGGNTGACKAASWYVDPSVDSTCDPVICEEAYKTGCTAPERSDCVKPIYKVRLT